MSENEKRQNDEIEALLAIYQNDFEEIVFPWKIKHLPQFRIFIRIAPETSITKSPVMLEFLVKFIAGYPSSEIPEFTLIDHCGCLVEFPTITKNLHTLAEESVGKEMIFDLVEFIREKFTRSSSLPPNNPTTIDELPPEQPEPKPKKQIQLIKEITESLLQKRTPSKKSMTKSLEFSFSIDDTESIDSIEFSHLLESRPKFSIWLGEHKNTKFFIHQFHTCNRRVILEFEKIFKNFLFDHSRTRDAIFGGFFVPVYSYGYYYGNGSGNEQQEEGKKIFLVSKYEEGAVSLEKILQLSGTLKFGKSLEFFKRILQALAHLHSVGIVHTSLECSCILLYPDYCGTVKICNNFYWGILQEKEKIFFSKKDDLVEAAKIFLKCLYGLEYCKEYPDSNIPEPVCRILKKIFTKSQYHSAMDLLSAEQEIFETETERGRNSPFASISLSDEAKIEEKTTSTSTSRYTKDFEELQFLGKGGFGSVVMARNILDNQIYAIKKIILDSLDETKKILREVTTLSRFHHQYITRYYQAWLEDVEVDDASSSTKKSSRTNSSVSPKKSLLKDFYFNDETYSFDSISENENSRTKCIRKCLFIQMEYCPNLSLRNVLDQGSIFTPDDSWKLFRQILEALAHIHEKGMIHRDLKPGNIFLDRNGDVKIGDFGLTISSEDDEDLENNLTSSIVGTPFYTSPEIHNSSCYTNKIDMYSLGIIFVELLLPPLQTGMERADILGKVRKKEIEFPPEFEQKFSVQSEIQRNLLDHDPTIRKSAKDLLKSPLLPGSVKVESGIIHDSIEMICKDRKSIHFQTLVELLFVLEERRKNFDVIADDFVFDCTGKESDADEGEEEFPFFYQSSCDDTKNQLSKIVKCEKWSRFLYNLQGVFYQHVFVEGKGSLILLPYNPTALEDWTDCVPFIDEFGNLVYLSPNLLISKSRQIAHNQLTNIKEYQISHSYKVPEEQSMFVGGQPKQVLECSLQTVLKEPNIMCLIEFVFIMYQVSGPLENYSHLQIFFNTPALIEQFFLKKFQILDHSFKLFLQGHSIDNLFGTKQLNFPSLLGFSSVDRLRNFLQKNQMTLKIPDNALEVLCQIYEIALSSASALDAISRILNLMQIYGQDSRIEKLRLFCNFLGLLGERCEKLKVTFDPTLMIPQQNDDDLVFAGYLVPDTTTTNTKYTKIGTGGEFTKLIKKYQLTDLEQYGYFLNIDLLNCFKIQIPDTLFYKYPMHVFFVSSLGESTLESRLRICFLLWKSGICAECNPSPKISQSELNQLILKDSPGVFKGSVLLVSGSGTPALKIKYLEGKKIVDLDSHESLLLDHVMQILNTTSVLVTPTKWSGTLLFSSSNTSSITLSHTPPSWLNSCRIHTSLLLAPNRKLSQSSDRLARIAYNLWIQQNSFQPSCVDLVVIPESFNRDTNALRKNILDCSTPDLDDVWHKIRNLIFPAHYYHTQLYRHTKQLAILYWIKDDVFDFIKISS